MWRPVIVAAMLAMTLLGSPSPGLSAPTEKPPEIAEVAGLPTGERLRIFTGPGSVYPIIGALRNGDGPVEILESVRWTRTEWVRISWIKEDAWVARQFLTPLDPPRIGGGGLRVGMICQGAEPFWSLDFFDDAQAEWRAPDADPLVLAVDQTLTAEARDAAPVALLLSGAERQTVLTLDARFCSDGASERTYGWRALLLERSAASTRLLEGCCGFPQN